MKHLHIVDTHPLLWYLSDSPRLSGTAAVILRDPSSELVLPAVAYGEACWIVEHGKVAPMKLADLQNALEADPRTTIYPLDRAVIDRSQSLAIIGEMHDRQIVATALVLADQGNQVTLIARDENITASGVVPTLW